MNRYFAWFGLPGSLVLTMSMSLYALVLALCFRTPVRWLCFAAMLLSSVGDIFLMRLNGLQRIFPNYFTIGAVFFMLAHVLYACCFALRIHQAGARFLNAGTAAALALCGACFVYFLHLGVSTKSWGDLPLVMGYLVVISIACVSVFSCAGALGRQHPLAILAAVGAVSFMASDAIIGLGMLTDNSRLDHLIWWLYPIGQILLITGAGY